MENKFRCVICEQICYGSGNNLQPIAEGLCCDECNNIVIKERLRIASEHKHQTKLKFP